MSKADGSVLFILAWMPGLVDKAVLCLGLIKKKKEMNYREEMFQNQQV